MKNEFSTFDQKAVNASLDLETKEAQTRVVPNS